MPRPTVIVFGYDRLLLDSLDILTAADSEIVAVVFPSNRTDERAGSIRSIVSERNLKIIEQPDRTGSTDFAAELCKLEPDVFLIWSYPMILPKSIVEIPKNGAVNIHMGLLPEYRGVNGVRWALLNGESHTGVTMHFIDEGIDTGDMIARATFPIEPDDDVRSLMIKSRAAGIQLLKQFWKHITDGNVFRQPQTEANSGYYSEKMTPCAIIDWNKSSVAIHDHIRAFAAPFEGAKSFWNEHELRIISSEHSSEKTASVAGTVLSVNANGLYVAAKGGTLLFKEIHCEGICCSVELAKKFGLVPGVILGADAI